ncbi:hypothetical protein [Streptomyces apocyni]|uniref:hypothetical protein n=1 Tax=Streptomyces apocyni TaxID=2654677 RepID=UPI0018D00E96|nr:hypothetical protein [Streptomyces apocyni]
MRTSRTRNSRARSRARTRALGAAALALTAAVTLAGCTDDPNDKAFGGLGDAGKTPSFNPSGMPSLKPPNPDGMIGGGSAGSTGVTGGSSGGSSGLTGGTSGGTGGSTGTTGGSSGLTSGGAGAPQPTRSAPPTYNPNALGEVVGQKCNASRSGAVVRISYEVDIQNASTEQAFDYTFSVAFKVGATPSSTIATKRIATRNERATVAPSGNRKVTLNASYTNNDKGVYSCQVTSARKTLSR